MNLGRNQLLSNREGVIGVEDMGALPQQLLIEIIGYKEGLNYNGSTVPV